MTNPMLGAEQAERLQHARELAGVSYRELSGTTGIPEATLRRKLGKRPDLLTIADLSALSDALDLEFGQVLAGAA